jgi:hypothetical protein
MSTVKLKSGRKIKVVAKRAYVQYADAAVRKARE